ncbi:MAG: carboxypeptidase-like regulatory domain-containing protein, partial [Anaerolineae bacterium]
MKGARFLTGAILLGLLIFPWAPTSGEEGATLIITGRVVDSQGVPLEGASIKIRVEDSQGVFIDEGGKATKSQADGSFLLALPAEIVALPMEGQGELTLEVSKASYAALSRTLDLEGMARIGKQLYLPLGDLILVYRMGAAF